METRRVIDRQRVKGASPGWRGERRECGNSWKTRGGNSASKLADFRGGSRPLCVLS